ncbi:MAG: c-type cytochrome, partial [Fimbriimonadaceae bacterium]|nr:c-type cytochrome [Alphaproteobacteria bacterium]
VWSEWNLAAAGGGDGTIRVWNSQNWDLRHIQENAFGPVWALALSPDGTTVYRAGLDDFVVGWTISPHEVFEQPKSVYPRRFQLTEDMSEGERQFSRKCSVCHTLEPDGRNRAGPTLYGIFGRRAGSVKGYPYSPGLAASKIVWDAETIGQLFDLGPEVVTPGSKMPLQRMQSVEARDELIAYLKVATAPKNHDIVEDNK